MAEYVIIAGHGKNKNGSYDTGAIGYDGTHEADYIRNKIIPTMKKYVPDNQKFTFVTEKSVYNHGNMADYKGKVVVEVHLDAFTPDARGGHVIVHSDFAPDKIDLAIRDVIAKYIGVRYTHKGHKGISGRADLANPNLAKANNINYRLIECAFISNKQDMDLLNKHLESFCKDLVQAICGASKQATAPKPVTKPKPAPKPATNQKTHKVVKGDSLWAIARKYGVTVANIKAWNNLKTDVIQPNQVLKVSKPVVNDGSIGSLQVTTAQLWYYNKADWNAKHGIAKKGEIFTVMQKLKVDDAWMYKLKSGMYISASTKYVSFKAK